MSPTWRSDTPPPSYPPQGIGWALVVLRLVPVLLVLAVGLGLMLVLRLIERPLFGLRRPVTPWITVAVCRLVLALLGLRMRVQGRRAGAALLVANHVAWLDIFVLNALRPLYFVAKAEVSGWPGINWLAKATGTEFIQRDRTRAQAQAGRLADRLQAGHRLLLFPEGTSSDGLRVLPFRSAMFAALEGLGAGAQVQPITLAYQAPDSRDRRFYGWWGDMEMVPHLLQVLAARPQGAVTVILHPALSVADYPDRKTLALAAQQAVSEGLHR